MGRAEPVTGSREYENNGRTLSRLVSTYITTERRYPPQCLLRLVRVFLQPSAILSSLFVVARSIGAMTASMTIAVAGTWFAALLALSESSLSRNGGALSMTVPMVGSPAMMCTFSEFSLSKKSEVDAAIVARAAEVTEYTFEDVETEAVPAAAPLSVQ